MTLFTSRSVAVFYDKLFSALDFELPHAATGRKGFPKEAMLCAFLVMICGGFSQISDLADYTENKRLIAHYCGLDIMKPLPSDWTYDRFLRNLSNDQLKDLMAVQVKKLYELGVVDASFVGLDPTPICANTRKNNSKPFVRTSFPRRVIQKATRTARWASIPRLISTMSGDTSFTGATRGLPLYELTSPANVVDSTVAAQILSAANHILSQQECSFGLCRGIDHRHSLLPQQKSAAKSSLNIIFFLF